MCYNSAMGPAAEGIIKYHERTKHHPYRYARSPGFLDWDNEPDPFRRFEGAPLIELPLLGTGPDTGFSSLFTRKDAPVQPFSLRTIAGFLELSLGISAWKSYGGNFWALRINPSSGNLHPTEAYLVLPPLPDDGLAGGVFHYNPLLHSLERRATFDDRFWSGIAGHFRASGFLAGLSSIHWRESWKYGERAFRYSQHDMGHAMAALSFAASLSGWKAACLTSLSDGDVETVLGFSKTAWKKFEKEEPGPLLFIAPDTKETVPRDIAPGIIRSFETLPFAGEPNRLSARHADWSVIDEASSLTGKPGTLAQAIRFDNREYLEQEPRPAKAGEIVRMRRSALAFDGKTAAPKAHFFSLLDRTVPRSGCAPFDLELGRPSVHLLLFVHRVAGLEPGLYFLVREEREMESIKQKCLPRFLWERVPDSPETLPLYLLERGDFRSQAAFASCGQEIAADGAFSAAMIARFRDAIEQDPYQYRHLHWEAGMVGQVLYLSAEACGLRGTGMGCFLDDAVHDLLGLKDSTYQDLYHFAVGKAAEDPRLITLPPYHHLAGRRKG